MISLVLWPPLLVVLFCHCFCLFLRHCHLYFWVGSPHLVVLVFLYFSPALRPHLTFNPTRVLLVKWICRDKEAHCLLFDLIYCSHASAAHSAPANLDCYPSPRCAFPCYQDEHFKKCNDHQFKPVCLCKLWSHLFLAACCGARLHWKLSCNTPIMQVSFGNLLFPMVE